VDRPAGVPEGAVYFPEWDEWGLGQRIDGQPEGDWRGWRSDGTFVEESSWRAGTCHGVKRRYHDDGSLATVSEYDHGVARQTTAYRPANPTREKGFDFDALPANFHTATFWFDAHGLAYRQEFREADGTEVDVRGRPVPARPATVPPEAYYNSENGFWVGARWQPVGAAPVGVRRHWDQEGNLYSFEYYRDGKQVAIVDARSSTGCNGSPLIEAARDGADADVQMCLDAGLGGAPGAALHSMYEGLPALSARLAAGTWNTDGSGQLVDPRAPAPRDGIDPQAQWVAGIGRMGAWVAGRCDPSGAAVGTWQVWRRDLFGEQWLEQMEFDAGRPALRREFAYWRLTDPAGAIHHDGHPLKEELHFDAAGTVVRSCKYDRGRLDTEVATRADGTVATRAHYPAGGLKSERVTRDEVLVSEEWFTQEGTRSAKVLPVDQPYVKKNGKEVAVEHWRGLGADDALVAEGFVAAGESGRPVGPWRLADGTSVDFAWLKVNRRADLGEVAVAVHAWQQLAEPPALAGAADVDWAGLETFFGHAKRFPFLLKGLATGDPVAFHVAIDELWDPILHQSTISEAAGPTTQYMVALVPGIDRADLCAALMSFVVRIASRDYDLAAAHEIKTIYRRAVAESKNPAKYLEKNNAEGAYHEVYAAISAAWPVWAQLAGDPDRDVRHLAIILLALAVGDDAAAALRERVVAEPDPALRADALLGLALHPLDDAAAGLLARFLTDDEPLARFCAALTAIRHRLQPLGLAADTLLAVLRHDFELTGFNEVFLAANSPTTDAATALALLPAGQMADHVGKLAAAIDLVNPVEAVSVVQALFDVVFPDEEGHDPDDELSAAQRAAVAAVAASDNAWTFNVNLAEVLTVNGLPTDRDGLRTLAAD
jgi:hypothetical protein